MEQHDKLSNNANYLLDELLVCPFKMLCKAYQISAESVCDFVTVSSRVF